MRSSALETSSHYHPDDILKRLLEDIGLSGRRGAGRPAPRNRSSRQMYSRQPAGSGRPSILSELLGHRFCRGMKTYAPSFTNCFAVARPMPLLPPVMSAIFPSCLPIYFSFVGKFLVLHTNR